MKKSVLAAAFAVVLLALGVAVGACGGGGGIVSDQFELHWELEGSDLLLAIDTGTSGSSSLGLWHCPGR